MNKNNILFGFLPLILLLQACSMPVKTESTPPQEKTARPTSTNIPPTRTSIPPTLTVTPQPSATPTPEPRARITAVKGNIFIRRGPDMAYNPVGVLYKGTSAEILMRDVLSKWAQIAIPNANQTGWVSLQTGYSQVEGDISALAEFKITDWPKPSYVRNCSLHKVVLYPGAIFIDSEVFEPENIAWVYPGTYKVYDLDMPDPTEIDSVTTSEGTTVDINYDATGNKHKCE